MNLNVTEVILGVLTLIGSLAASWWAVRSKRVEASSSPYESLAKRVVALETKVGALEEEQQADRDFIREMIRLWSEHMPNRSLPLDLPPWYKPTRARKDHTDGNTGNA